MKKLNSKLLGVVALVVLFGTVASANFAAQGISVEDWATQTITSDYFPIAETTDSMYPGNVDWFSVRLEGGVSYSIDLIVPWNSDFEIKVFDENGNLVGSGTRGTGENEEVFITPRWTGEFEVKVYYYGGSSGAYKLRLYRDF